jgi:DNA polymerase III delta subunit
MKKTWWLDDTDTFLAQEKLKSVRTNQLSEWDWVRFDESAYSTPEDALCELLNDLCAPPMFSKGKVVYCFGIPFMKKRDDKKTESAHEKIAEQLPRMPEGVVFIIVARPRSCTLYKAFKEMVKSGEGSADEAFELTRENAVEWIEKKAQYLKMTIDRPAATTLADITDFNAPRICCELLKLKHTVDGHITTKAVELTCDGPGFVDIWKLGDLILFKKADEAHSLIQRMMDRGEPPIKICGLLHDWLLKLCIADSCDGDNEKVKELVGCMYKWQKESDDEEGGIERVRSDDWGWFLRPKGKKVAFMANTNATYYACKNLKAANVSPRKWTYDAYKKLGHLQRRLRDSDSDKEKLMHVFVDSIIFG